MTLKVIVKKPNCSNAMFTYLLIGERKLTINRFNTLIVLLDIKKGKTVHKELINVKRLMFQSIITDISISTSKSVRESLMD